MNRLSKIFLSMIVILIILLGIMTYLYFDMRENAKNNLNELLRVSEEYSKKVGELSTKIETLKEQEEKEEAKNGRIYKVEENRVYFTNLNHENGSLQVDENTNLINGRTEEKMELEDIKESDFVEIQDWRNDGKVRVYRNIRGEELKNELLVSLSLPSSNLMTVGLKEIEQLEDNEAIVTIVVNDFVEPQYYDEEEISFEIKVKFTKNTVYSSRGNNVYDVSTLQYAVGNINDLRLDVESLGEEYPEVVEFNTTDT